MTSPRAAARLAWGVVSIVFLASCAGADEPPTRLVDGSQAHVPDVSFEGVTVPVVQTVARRTEEAARCGLGTSDGSSVERVGASGTSITTRSLRMRSVRACDGTTPGVWCGQAYARLRPDRPLDARLSLTCEGRDGEAVGFAWVVPMERTRFVVVSGDGHAESYPVLGGVPIRVTSEDVDTESSSARFEVSEHAGNGRRLGAYELVARVAG